MYITGVVYEYCVGFTAKDALNLGFKTAVIEDAVMHISKENKIKMRDELIALNALIIRSSDVLEIAQSTGNPMTDTT